MPINICVARISGLTRLSVEGEIHRGEERRRASGQTEEDP